MVVDPTGEQLTMWSATQIPHILRFALAATTGVPESKIRVIAPDVGGGFGGKLQATPEEWIAWAVARRLMKPVKYTETRSESLMAAHHGRDQVQTLTLAADKDGKVTGAQGAPRRRPRRLRRDRRRWRAGPRCLHVQRDLQVPGLPLRVPDRPHQHHVHRRLPRRRPAGGDVRHRAADGRARRRGGRRPAGDPRAQLDHPRGVPVHHGRGPGVRHRQLRGGHGEGEGVLRLRRAARGAEGAPRPRRPGPARHRRLDLHRDVRPRAQPGPRQPRLRRRRLGERERADDAPRQGRGRHRRQRPRAGPRDGVQPDRRRPARRPVRGRRGAARRHPGRPEGPRHLRLALAGRRRRGARQGRRQGDRQGQGRSPRTCSRPTPTTSSTPAGGSPSAAPTRAWRSRSCRRRPSPATTTPTAWS